MRVPTGRYERRVAKAEAVELLHVDQLSETKLGAITENVSPRGARIITDSICAPGKRVLLSAPDENVKSLARVVYCHPVENRKFAVGLQLVMRVKEWQTPH